MYRYSGPMYYNLVVILSCLFLHQTMGLSNIHPSIVFSKHRTSPIADGINAGVSNEKHRGRYHGDIATVLGSTMMRRGQHPRKTSLHSLSSVFGTIEWSDLLYDDPSTALNAFEWTANMGAPAALIGGAVLVTLSETRESLSPQKDDKKWIRLSKLCMRYLLLTSFALEVISIFVGTMTGGILLSHGPQQKIAKIVGYQSPLQLLHHHHELEYLTTQICFLQGLLNWLGAVSLELLLPRPNENKTSRKMNQCLAGWLFSFMIWMVAFYNNHLSFYSDYMSMLKRFVILFVKDYFFGKSFRPLSILYGPAFAISSFWTWRAFSSPPEDDEEYGDDETTSSSITE